MKVKAKVPGPWGKIGDDFEMDEADENLQWHLSHGHLVEVDEDGVDQSLTPKQQAVARAEALGLDSSGTQKEIEERIKAHGGEGES